MATHELKCWPEAFQPTWIGIKIHEIRRYDRPFKEGDTLILLEWDPKRDINDRFTGRRIFAIIKYISLPNTFGMPDYLCVMSLNIIDCDKNG